MPSPRPKDPLVELVSQPLVLHKSLAGLLAGGSSGEGWHQTMASWTCPEKMRQRILGTVNIYKEQPFDYDGTSLSPLAFGSLWHYLLEVQAHKKTKEQVLHALNSIQDIPDQSRQKMETLFLAYAQRYPKTTWKALGVECKIRVPIPVGRKVWRIDPKTGKGRFTEVFYSVRYDKVVIAPGSHKLVQAIEHKTASRMSPSTLSEWRMSGQVIGQKWAWDRHPASTRYGPIYQVVMDFAVKTQEPAFIREPLVIGKAQTFAFTQSLIDWVLTREHFEKAYGLDRPWPRTWACTDRYSSCPFVDSCHYDNSAALSKRVA